MDVILEVLKKGPMSGAQISKALNMWSGTLYPLLWKLENEGRIVANWADEPKPRRRFYRIADV